MTMHIRAGAITDVGCVRELNEDGYLVDTGIALLAVADGMGGHQSGEVASALALDVLYESVKSGKRLKDAVAGANRAVYEHSLQAAALNGMGTTLTSVLIAEDGIATVGHVGDSRAYLRRDGELSAITRDHSVVARLTAAGRAH